MSQVTETSTSSSSPMRKISLEKVVLNMGVGKSGDVIDIAKKALDQISGRKSCAREAKETQRDWGIRKGEPIGVAVTIRGEQAVTLLKRLLEAKGNTVNGRSFDNFGNYSFGIREHIDIPGVKYDPQIGILGLGNFCNANKARIWNKKKKQTQSKHRQISYHYKSRSKRLSS